MTEGWGWSVWNVDRRPGYLELRPQSREPMTERELRAYLADLFRITKPGGELIVRKVNLGSDPATFRDVRRAIRRAGFHRLAESADDFRAWKP
jgi:hypothetical protein